MISSSNADAAALLASGALRPDFYYRINVVTLTTLPPLRERPEDLAPLARLFLRRTKFRRFDAEAERICATTPGRATCASCATPSSAPRLVEESDAITAASLPLGSASDLIATAARGQWTLEDLESHYIRLILDMTRRTIRKRPGSWASIGKHSWRSDVSTAWSSTCHPEREHSAGRS